jgi:hypothetical protein
MVSVLVSVADALPLKPLLHPQFGLEARVGIELTPLSQAKGADSLARSVSNIIVIGFCRGAFQLQT